VDFSLSLEPDQTLVVHLQEGIEQTTVSVRPAVAGATSLLRAADQAVTDGYGECFWPGATGGQYWWILKRVGDSMEMIAMWTRGGASSWEHVFRATDSADWIEERLTSEIDRLALRADS
jgi:hypothetical protein